MADDNVSRGTSERRAGPRAGDPIVEAFADVPPGSAHDGHAYRDRGDGFCADCPPEEIERAKKRVVPLERLKRFLRYRSDVDGDSIGAPILQHSEDGLTFEDVPAELLAGLSVPEFPVGDVRAKDRLTRVTIQTPGMTTVGEVVERAFGFGNPGDWPVCGQCGGSFPRLIEREQGKVHVCQGCATVQDQREALAEEVRRIAAKMPTNLARWLRRAGMSDREQQANLGRIPERIQRDLPAGTVANLTSGIVPVHGFGLRGTAGTGKTFTLAALMKKLAEVRIASNLPTLGRRAFDPWMAWVAWPELVNRLRVLASRDDGVAEGDEIMARFAASEVLILDDLGAERWKAEDWVGSLLDLLVDARYKAERPTFYTTHLVPDEMQDRYGARLWSRLTGDNPLIAVSQGPDLRVVR